MKEKQADLPEILKVFREKSSFLITCHESPCGDAIGSELAMNFLLKRLGKKTFMRNPNRIPDNFFFLPGVNEILSGFDLKQLPEVLLIVDCANLERVGRGADIINKSPMIINIDHHESNTYFGTLNYVDVGAASTGEMIYPIFKQTVGEIRKEEAVCIYTSILADTGSFQHAGTKPHTHEIAARLLDLGIDPSFVSRQLFGNFSLANRKLLGLALSTLKISKDKKIAWFKVTRDMYANTGAREADAHDFIDYVYSMKDVCVSFLLRESSNENVKVSLRSNLLDVNQIAQEFGGGGHKRAAGSTVNGKIEQVEGRVLETVRRFLKKAEKGRESLSRV